MKNRDVYGSLNMDIKNYNRENSAKDAFSLWENENSELVRSLNEKIKDCKLKLVQTINIGNINEAIKYVDKLEDSIINLHCSFEDWLFLKKGKKE